MCGFVGYINKEKDKTKIIVDQIQKGTTVIKILP